MVKGNRWWGLFGVLWMEGSLKYGRKREGGGLAVRWKEVRRVWVLSRRKTAAIFG